MWRPQAATIRTSISIRLDQYDRIHMLSHLFVAMTTPGRAYAIRDVDTHDLD